jgi:hypothetical protein
MAEAAEFCGEVCEATNGMSLIVLITTFDCFRFILTEINLVRHFLTSRLLFIKALTHSDNLNHFPVHLGTHYG